MGGLSILSSVPVSAPLVCLLCASKGLHQLVLCQVCCQPFHSFCLGAGEAPGPGQAGAWSCRRCRSCGVCARRGRPSKPLLECRRCRRCFHPTCLGPGAPPRAPPGHWVCWGCQSCGTPEGGEGQDPSPITAEAGEGLSPPRDHEEPPEGGEGPEPPPGSPRGVSGPALREVLQALLSSAHGPALLTCAQCPPGGPPTHSGPCDVGAVAHLAEGGAYGSLEEFSRDVAAVLLRKGRGHPDHAPSQDHAPNSGHAPDSGHAPEPGHAHSAQELFIKLMGGAFPWFDARDPKIWSPPETPKAPPLPVAPPSSDHTYARWRPEPAPPSPGEEGAEPPVPGGGGADERQCALCLRCGDAPAQEEGRLLYLGQNEWCHVNCALWSAEVFEEGDGTLRNVHAAVARGRQMRCEHCGRPGATVGCCLAACAANFHFTCARRCRAAFLRDKRVFCQRHGRLLAGEDLVRDGAFAVLRRVLVDFGGISLKRKFLGGLEPEAVNVMIGSIRIDHLGALSELSERDGRLFPVGYTCWRLYWSTRDPRRRCWYRCRILEHSPGPDGGGGGAGTPPGPPPEHNRTIAHGSPGHVPPTPRHIPNLGDTEVPPRPRRPPPRSMPLPRPSSPKGVVAPPMSPSVSPPGPPQGWGHVTTRSPRGDTSDDDDGDSATTAVTMPPRGRGRYFGYSRTVVAPAVALSPLSPCPQIRQVDGADDATRGTVPPEVPPMPPEVPPMPPEVPPSAEGLPADIVEFVLRGGTGDGDSGGTWRGRRGGDITQGHHLGDITKSHWLGDINQGHHLGDIDGGHHLGDISQSHHLGDVGEGHRLGDIVKSHHVGDIDGGHHLGDIDGGHHFRDIMKSHRVGDIGQSHRLGDIGQSRQIGDIDGGHQVGDIDGGHRLGDIDGGHHLGDIVKSHQVGDIDQSHRLGDIGQSHRLRDIKGGHHLGDIDGGHRLGDIMKSHRFGDIMKCHQVGDIDGRHRLGDIGQGHRFGDIDQGHHLGDIDGGHQVGDIVKSHHLGDIDGCHRLGDITKSHQLGDILKCHQVGDINQGHHLGDIGQSHQIEDIDGCHQVGDIDGRHRFRDIGQGHHLGDILKCHQVGDIDGGHQFGDIVQGHQRGDILKSHQVGDIDQGHHLGDTSGTLWGHRKRPGEGTGTGTGTGTKRPRLEPDTDGRLKEEPEELMSDSCGSPPGDVTAEAEPPWAACAGGSSEEEEPTPGGGGGARGGPAPSPPLPHLRFEISSEDGLRVAAPSLEGAWRAVLERLQEARANAHLGHLSFAGMSGLRLLGIQHDAVLFLLEQLPGAGSCSRYRFRYHPPRRDPPAPPPPRNPSGCARAELYMRKCTFDMFSFLASQHRALPQGPPPREEEEDEVQLKPTRRATSLELPMAMRFRHLKRTAKEAVGVYRSAIHGRGLFCKRNIEAGEMVIEYSGIVVRSVLTDKREKFYDSKGIGCYMFRIDEAEVVDATMHGSAARFINHSCEPNCYSRVIHVEGHKRIVIFALRRILRGEELTYDYKFPIEEPAAKLPCNCGARRCRRFLN